LIFPFLKNRFSIKTSFPRKLYKIKKESSQNAAGENVMKYQEKQLSLMFLILFEVFLPCEAAKKRQFWDKSHPVSVSFGVSFGCWCRALCCPSCSIVGG